MHLQFKKKNNQSDTLTDNFASLDKNNRLAPIIKTNFFLLSVVLFVKIAFKKPQESCLSAEIMMLTLKIIHIPCFAQEIFSFR